MNYSPSINSIPKYQFDTIHTASIIDGKVTNQASILPNLRYSNFQYVVYSYFTHYYQCVIHSVASILGSHRTSFYTCPPVLADQHQELFILKLCQRNVGPMFIVLWPAVAEWLERRTLDREFESHRR